MDNLPIFPLNTVLFPGAPLRLHIFEPRYRRMLQDCLAADSRFGVCLIERGREALGPLPEPHSLGCSAIITATEPLDHGRTSVQATGRQRFRILHLQRDHEYLRAEVKSLDMAPAGPGSTILAASLKSLLPRYLEQLSGLELWQGRLASLPSDPIRMAYLCAAVLKIPKSEKQSLLSTSEPEELLGRIERFLQREIALLQPLADRGPQRLKSAFPLN